ncbi:hypothetical protein J6590_066007 [Homalodisca vitripennis]|nr:hypothetical protein J6590_066007 [Homalodisca vitripennis]
MRFSTGVRWGIIVYCQTVVLITENTRSTLCFLQFNAVAIKSQRRGRILEFTSGISPFAFAAGGADKGLGCSASVNTPGPSCSEEVTGVIEPT